MPNVYVQIGRETSSGSVHHHLEAQTGAIANPSALVTKRKLCIVCSGLSASSHGPNTPAELLSLEGLKIHKRCRFEDPSVICTSFPHLCLCGCSVIRVVTTTIWGKSAELYHSGCVCVRSRGGGVSSFVSLKGPTIHKMRRFQDSSFIEEFSSLATSMWVWCCPFATTPRGDESVECLSQFRESGNPKKGVH